MAAAVLLPGITGDEDDSLPGLQDAGISAEPGGFGPSLEAAVADVLTALATENAD